jgi:PE-PPE domain
MRIANTRARGRRVGIVCGATVGSALLAISTAASGWGVSTALVIGGIGTPVLHDVVMSQLLGGALRDDQRVSVDWPAEARPYTGADDMTLGASIEIGQANLEEQIEAALARLERDENGDLLEGERVTVVGLSAGSLVVTETLRDMATDPDAPDEEAINFIVVADSSRQQLVDSARYNPEYDYTYQPAPDTEYDTVVVTGEYDGYADFPDRPWNLLAVANAMAGSIFVHVPTMFSDLSEVPEENITVEMNALGGTTTHYLVPAERLPLVLANPSLAPREAELRAQIDRAYIRNDPVPSLLRSLFNNVPDDVEDTVTPEDDPDADTASTVAAENDSAQSEEGAAETAAPLDVTVTGDTADQSETSTAADVPAETERDRGDAVEQSDATDSDSVTNSDSDEAGQESEAADASDAATEAQAAEAGESATAEQDTQSSGGADSSDDASSDDTGDSGSADSTE